MRFSNSCPCHSSAAARPRSSSVLGRKSEAILRKVNLSTGAVSLVPYSLDAAGDGSWSVVIDGNGRGLLTPYSADLGGLE